MHLWHEFRDAITVWASECVCVCLTLKCIFAGRLLESLPTIRIDNPLHSINLLICKRTIICEFNLYEMDKYRMSQTHGLVNHFEFVEIQLLDILFVSISLSIVVKHSNFPNERTESAGLSLVSSEH